MPVSSGGRTLLVLFALIVGLVAGFAGGFVIGQQRVSIPAPRAAAEPPRAAPTPAAAVPAPEEQTYTDAPVADAVQETPVPPEQPQQPDSMRRGPSRPAIAAISEAGSLAIASRPAGAQVFVDDRRVGVTPMSLASLQPGTHRVRLDLPGHKTWATTVDLGSGAHERVGASLQEN